MGCVQEGGLEAVGMLDEFVLIYASSLKDYTEGEMASFPSTRDLFRFLFKDSCILQIIVIVYMM